MLVCVQEVPGVIKVQRRKCVLLWGGLDPCITQFIDVAGFIGLFKVHDMEVDYALITALVEWWHLETHMLHLSYGEMGITLQDIEVMLRISVDGLPVTRKTDVNWSLLCQELLGH